MISSCLSLTSLWISLFALIPRKRRERANTRNTATIITLSVFPLFYGDIMPLMVSVGTFLPINFAIEMLLSLENAIIFLTSYEAVMQKFVKAKNAKPSSKIDLSPPIILNHSSTTFLSCCSFWTRCLGSSGRSGSTVLFGSYSSSFSPLVLAACYNSYRRFVGW